MGKKSFDMLEEKKPNKTCNKANSLWPLDGIQLYGETHGLRLSSVWHKCAVTIALFRLLNSMFYFLWKSRTGRHKPRREPFDSGEMDGRARGKKLHATLNLKENQAASSLCCSHSLHLYCSIVSALNAQCSLAMASSCALRVCARFPHFSFSAENTVRRARASEHKNQHYSKQEPHTLGKLLNLFVSNGSRCCETVSCTKKQKWKT